MMCARCPAAFASLALLPCEPLDAVLPGETMELHLGEAWECRMLERAMCGDNNGCFALLLKYGEGADDTDTDADAHTQTHTHAQSEAEVDIPWLPLLQVMEIREPDDAGGVEGFVLVRARCVSRVHLTEKPRRRGFDAFETAAAAAYVDRDVVATGSALAARVAEAAPLHASCRYLEARLWPRSRDAHAANMCASLRARHASAAERCADSEEVLHGLRTYARTYVPTYLPTFLHFTDWLADLLSSSDPPAASTATRGR